MTTSTCFDQQKKNKKKNTYLKIKVRRQVDKPWLHVGDSVEPGDLNNTAGTVNIRAFPPQVFRHGSLCLHKISWTEIDRYGTKLCPSQLAVIMESVMSSEHTYTHSHTRARAHSHLVISNHNCFLQLVFSERAQAYWEKQKRTVWRCVCVRVCVMTTTGFFFFFF